MTDSDTNPGDEAPFCVGEPFTANDHADIIIRSSDGHDFHVLKGNLAIVSTIFKDMFSLPQPRAAQETDVTHILPVVDVSESGPVIDALLRYIYPVNAPNIVSVDVAFGVLLATKKYEMNLPLCNPACVISNLCSNDDESISRSFALAYRHRLSEEIRASAKASLRINLMDAVSLNTVFLKALHDVSGKAVVYLFRYHAEVRQKLAKLFSEAETMFSADIVPAASCHMCGAASKLLVLPGGNKFRWSRWWSDMTKKAGQVIHSKSPMSKDVFSQEIVGNAASNACSNCMPHILRFGVGKLHDSMMNTIKRTVSEVKFEIPWVEEQS